MQAEKWVEEGGKETERANPDDAAAHDVLGAWYCLVQDDWARGLGHLARGGDSQLRGLARAELAPTPRRQRPPTRLPAATPDGTPPRSRPATPG